MANPDHGKCDCPVCGAPGAAVRVNKRQRAYVHCDACMVQIQARGPVSDSAIRGRVKDDLGNSGGAAAVVLAGGKGVGVGEAGGGEVGRMAEARTGAGFSAGNAPGAGGDGSRSEKPAATIPQAQKPAKPKAAAVIHTAEGVSVAGVVPEVPEFNIFDGLAGLFK